MGTCEGAVLADETVGRPGCNDPGRGAPEDILGRCECCQGLCPASILELAGRLVGF